MGRDKIMNMIIHIYIMLLNTYMRIVIAMIIIHFVKIIDMTEIIDHNYDTMQTLDAIVT